MPRPCSICAHPRRAAIDKRLVAGDPLRRIAADSGVSETTLRRHRDAHLTDLLERAERRTTAKTLKRVEAEVERRSAQEDASAIDVMLELRRLFDRMNKLLDACDRWLTDPDNEEQYDVGPRAFEVKVTYELEEPIGDGDRTRTIRKKATLQEILNRAERATGGEITMVETKHADIRTLIIQTAARLQGQLELLSKLIGKLDERPQLNLLLMPEWAALKGEILKALRPYPEARTAIAAAMRDVRAGDG